MSSSQVDDALTNVMNESNLVFNQAGRFTAEEIYSTKRSEVETLIQSEASLVLMKPGNNIVMKSLLIRSISLPDQIKNAIEWHKFQAGFG